MFLTEMFLGLFPSFADMKPREHCGSFRVEKESKGKIAQRYQQEPTQVGSCWYRCAMEDC
jgi:hypothetical protein